MTAPASGGTGRPQDDVAEALHLDLHADAANVMLVGNHDVAKTMTA